MKAPRILMVGLSCIDHLWQVETFPPVHSRTQAHQYSVQGGGPAATAAVTAARLGAYCQLWAVHGADASAKFAEAELAHYGVDTSGIIRLEGATSFVSAVLIDPKGERHIFPFRGQGLLDSAAGLDLESVASYEALHVDARHPIMCQAALEAAKEAGVPCLADFSNSKHWHLTKDLDYLLVSEECAAEVLGRHDPKAALAALKQHDSQVVGITLGQEGFLYSDSGQIWHIPALEVEVVDTTGAGDVFHGAYAYGVAKRWDTARCGLFASITAALSCTGIGRTAIPDAQTVERLLETRSVTEIEAVPWT